MRPLLFFVWLVLGWGMAAYPADNAPKGLQALRVPPDNPQTDAKIALGKQLYFDPRLSSDDTVSCASCHDPKKGWSNGEAVATGIRGLKGGRSAPTIINSAYQDFQFWDGRAWKLEGQALGPIQNPIEMDMKLETLTAKLNKIDGYRRQFQAVFGSDATPDAIAKAISAFERTVLSGDAPFDQHKQGQAGSMSEAAVRGMKVFFNSAQCSACHSGPSFTDGGFHNVGVGMEKADPDLGRFAESRIDGDRGAFKTPTLREIGRTAPYMHNGRFKSLDEVVNYYDQGGFPNPTLDEEIFPLKLTPQQKTDLVTFLKEGLTSRAYPDAAPPELPK